MKFPDIGSGAVDGLNLYVYVDNNPLKYIDPTGHGVDTIIFDNFLDRINRDKTGELNICIIYSWIWSFRVSGKSFIL
jgi:hypothetical protein